LSLQVGRTMSSWFCLFRLHFIFGNCAID
jgi:hypothetical protein